MAIYLPQLSAHDVSFPKLESALREPDGLLAMGGDLSTARLLSAYNQGIFPWFTEGEPILWWSPSVRALFPPNSLRLNRTLRRQIHRYNLSFSCNTAFSKVIDQCAAPRTKQSYSWILPQMQQAYLALHQKGWAHSIEVWQHKHLVGGLYGVQIGQLFCGESMFNLIPDAAKLALVMLQQHLQKEAPGWIDCQLPNPFLLQMGACKMPRHEYLMLLQQLQVQSVPAEHWVAQTLIADFSHA